MGRAPQGGEVLRNVQIRKMQMSVGSWLFKGGGPQSGEEVQTRGKEGELHVQGRRPCTLAAGHYPEQGQEQLIRRRGCWPTLVLTSKRSHVKERHACLCAMKLQRVGQRGVARGRLQSGEAGSSPERRLSQSEICRAMGSQGSSDVLRRLLRRPRQMRSPGSRGPEWADGRASARAWARSCLRLSACR